MRWSVPTSGEVSAEVTAAPDQVWGVLSDPTRTGEWSHECHTVAWQDGHDRPVVGARFRGRNRAGQVRWARTCTITEVEPERLLVFRTSGGYPPDSTEWRFRLTPLADGGTRITQSYRIISMPKYLEVMIVLLLRQHLDRRAALTGDLVRLGEVASRVPAVS
jgi:uncharacterized protein YndB with AHSA1/START domain